MGNSKFRTTQVLLEFLSSQVLPSFSSNSSIRSMEHYTKPKISKQAKDTYNIGGGVLLEGRKEMGGEDQDT